MTFESPVPSPDSPAVDSETSEWTSKDICNAIAGLYKRFLGRGPENVRALWDRDMLVLTLSGGAIVLERTLTDAGEGQAVRDLATSFQKVMQPHYETIVRAGTGREIAAFMSVNHNDPDLHVEIFVLGDPVADATAARDAAARLLDTR